MEDFDFGELASSMQETSRAIALEEVEKKVRASWGSFAGITAGIYRDAKAHGLPEPLAQLWTKQFMIPITEMLNGDRGYGDGI